jgi:multicomponent Na+:H+ antiporter subunit G
MSFLDAVSILPLALALFFFTAGTIGLLRLPDTHSCLHALTKADNVGLGFTVFAVMLHAGSWTTVFKLALIWLLVLSAGANVSFLIANRIRRSPHTTQRGEEKA